VSAPTPRARALTWLDHAIGAGLALGFLVALLATLDIGFTRDEGYYFRAAFQYLGWFKELSEHLAQGEPGLGFTQESIDRHLGFNQEHPVLLKGLYSLSYWLFSETLGWLRPSSAMRLPSILSSAALAWLVYAFTAEAFGRWQGVFAAVATAAMPRPFFHAHLACFDYPVTTLWFLVMYGWWKGLRSTGWGWATGIFLGLGLSVKHNIFFVPATLGVHWLLLSGHKVHLVRVDGRARLQLPPLPVAFLSMAVLGPLVWYLLWPNHWFDTWNRIAWYFRFHLKHVHYFQNYFGQNLYAPPFPVAFPFVMSLLTMPPVTLLAAALGSGAVAGDWLRAVSGERLWEPLRRRARALWGDGEVVDPRGTGLWLALGAFVPFAVIAMPSTPIFGGIKHWMPAMPFLAILAGVGAVHAARALTAPLRDPRARAAATAAVLALALSPAIWDCAHTYNKGTAHYNALIGGPRGAADADMMRQFWGYSGYFALDFINEHAPARGNVYFQNTNHDAYQMYQREGALRADLRYGTLANADFALFHHQKAFRALELDIWREFKTRNPVLVITHDGVPVLSVYARHWPPRGEGAGAPRPSRPAP
jgi:4-amino-4-deoxy-L-arabinose transferase-like glycosyltransferase